MKSAVALALASMAAAASAGQFTGPTTPSTAASAYATQNFGSGALVTADNITLPVTQNVVFTTGVGISGGYVVNPSGIVYFYLRLANAKWAAAPAAVDFSIGGLPTFTAGTPVLSTDGMTVLVPMTNTSASTASIGSGATITYAGGAKVLTPTSLSALGAPGGSVTVTGALSGTTNNANVATLPNDIDSAAAFTVLNTASAITGSVTPGTTTKIAVDAVSQRMNFVGGALVATLGALEFDDVTGNQLQVDGATDYTTVSPAGRTIDASVTAGSGSFNAGTLTIETGGCGGTVLATGTLNATKTVATFTGAVVQPTATPISVCYAVTGSTQINEVTGIIASATLQQPAGGINDQTVSASGSLANIVNDGTVIDLRNYVPASANEFGYAMLVRVINTGSNNADIFGQYLDATTGMPIGSQTVLGTTAAGGVLELTNTQVEAALGAPAAGANSRLRIVAPTSSLSVQMWMRSNGTWVELTGGQTNANTPSTNSYDPSRQ